MRGFSMKPKLQKPRYKGAPDFATMVRKLRATAWPNDCPECGSRMQFAFPPSADPKRAAERAFRQCTCGHVVTLRTVLRTCKH